jgi:hypothetical protein
MGSKCDMARWRDDVGQRRGDTGEGKAVRGDDVNLTRPKNKKNHTVDLAGINGQ